MNPRWTQNRDLIRRLYVEERKTLSEVKKELEDNHGFPQATLASYEIMVRDKLGLIKKLKKDHWPKLYQQWEHRGRRDFDLYDGDSMLYPWKKVWKELRRSRKTRIRNEMNLPERLTLRTPPPPSHEQAIVHSSSSRNSPAREETPIPLSVNPTSPLPQEIGPLPTSTDSANYLYQTRGLRTMPSRGTTMVPRERFQQQQRDSRLQSFIKAQVETVPWVEVRLWLLSSWLGPEKVLGNIEVVDGYYFALIPHDGLLHRQPGQVLARISDTTFPNIWDLSMLLDSATALTNKSDLYLFMAVAIYVFSNDLLNSHDDSHGLIARRFLDMLQFSTPQKQLRQLFESNALSVKVAWDVLLRQSIRIHHQNGFSLIVNTALDSHLSWIEHDLYLAMGFSARTGDIKLLRRLIASIPIITDQEEMASCYVGGMVYSALAGNSIDCAKLLIQSYDVNSRGVSQIYGEDGSLINFMQFLILISERWTALAQNNTLSEEQQKEMRNMIAVLDAYLEAGARFNLPYSPFPRVDHIGKVLETHPEWRPTCLEAILYLSMPMFYHLQQYKIKLKASTELTRSGIYLAAYEGVESLAQYLDSRPAHKGQDKDKFLELILVEQFISYKYPTIVRSGTTEWYGFIDIDQISVRFETLQLSVRVARGLMEYGVSPGKNILGPQKGPNWLLAMLLTNIGSCDWTDDVSFLLQHILQEGAIFDPFVTSLAVRQQGNEILELIQLHGCEIKEMGTNALAEAALEGNVDAVEWLLTNGVDVNAETSWITQDGMQLTVIGAIFDSRRTQTFDDQLCYGLISFKRFRQDRRLILPTVKQLIQAGARLSVTRCDQNAPLGFLRMVLSSVYDATGGNIDEYKAIFWFLATLPESDRLSLEMWDQILVELLGSGPDEPKNGNWDLFEGLLRRRCNCDTGPFLSAFILSEVSDDLIQEAISETANINDSLPTCYGSMTPMQAAASRCNEQLVFQLFNQGANINAPRGSGSPLSRLCFWSPVTSEESQRQTILIKFFLENGADVDSRTEYDEDARLYNCVHHGRLDQVKLLLEHGADPNTISYLPSTLDYAITRGRLDIAKLLLNVGALGGIPGVTGYDSTIRLAKGHMAELLRNHLAEKNKIFDQHPGLRSAHTAVVDKQNIKCCEWHEKIGKFPRYSERGMYFVSEGHDDFCWIA